MPVVLTAVVPQPRIDLRSADGESGAPVRVTTYRGVAVLEEKWSKGLTVRVGGLPQANPISFFLPDSLAYPVGTEATVSLALSLRLQPVCDMTNVGEGPYGVHSGSAALREYPEGGDVRWVHIAFVNTFARTVTEVTYDVTVTTPLDGSPS